MHLRVDKGILEVDSISIYDAIFERGVLPYVREERATKQTTHMPHKIANAKPMHIDRCSKATPLQLRRSRTHISSIHLFVYPLFIPHKLIHLTGKHLKVDITCEMQVK